MPGVEEARAGMIQETSMLRRSQARQCLGNEFTQICYRSRELSNAHRDGSDRSMGIQYICFTLNFGKQIPNCSAKIEHSANCPEGVELLDFCQFIDHSDCVFHCAEGIDDTESDLVGIIYRPNVLLIDVGKFVDGREVGRRTVQTFERLEQDSLVGVSRRGCLRLFAFSNSQGNEYRNCQRKDGADCLHPGGNVWMVISPICARGPVQHQSRAHTKEDGSQDQICGMRFQPALNRLPLHDLAPQQIVQCTTSVPSRERWASR